MNQEEEGEEEEEHIAAAAGVGIVGIVGVVVGVVGAVVGVVGVVVEASKPLDKHELVVQRLGDPVKAFGNYSLSLVGVLDGRL